MTTRRELLLGAGVGVLLPLVSGCSKREKGATAAAPGAVVAAGAPTATDAAGPTLGALRAATITVGDLKVVEDAWTKFMGYRVIARGQLSQATADGWGAPALRDNAFSILGPESGEPVYLRFVEQEMPKGHDPKRTTLGWNTTEITVQNTDRLYERLKDSPFVVRGPPRTMSDPYTYLRPMGGVTGPGGATFNLTWITEPRPDLAPAKSFVGSIFIATLGTMDLPTSLKWFEATFGNVAGPIVPLSPTFQLAVVPLQHGTKLEVDHLGVNATPPGHPPGGLPPGLALVTFECSQFDRFQDRFVQPAAASALEPHLGRRTGTMVGPSGELYELVDAWSAGPDA